jgi:D-alanyl-D-alanine carboxypeptidase
MNFTSYEFWRSPNVPVLITTGGAFGVACLLAGVTYFVSNREVVAPRVVVYPQTVSFDQSLITAKAAVVYDPQKRRVLFEKNAYAALPLASLTKLMTAQTVLNLRQDNGLVAITPDDLIPEGDWGLEAGQTWHLRDLLTFGLVASANDAMAAAAAAASPNIIEEMNRSAEGLGLTQTYFLNPTGLDEDPETAGAYGSAYDMALLASTFLQDYPELFEATAKPKVTIESGEVRLEANSTDTPILDIPGLIAAKTGYTDLAGGNLVAIFDIEIGHPVVVAVLGSTRDARFSDVRELVGALRLAADPNLEL